MAHPRQVTATPFFAAAPPAVMLNSVVRRGDLRLAGQRRIAEVDRRAVLPRPPERIGGLDIAFHDPERQLTGWSFADSGAVVRTLAEEARRRCGGGMTDDTALLAVRRPGMSPGVIG
ncbi:hypothetical protein [Streptomyces sp. NPDC000983]|uniref:hypothetical protein n=1 Tax=Streptomyces sp. NPDC000983 TaxID=3154373 RepID=UPI003327C1D4